MKIYDLNIESIIHDKHDHLTYEDREIDKISFFQRNIELKKEIDKYLMNNHNKVIIRFNNKFYKLCEINIENFINGTICDICDFKKEETREKENGNLITLCVPELLTSDAGIYFKEIEEYEAFFGKDTYESL